MRIVFVCTGNTCRSPFAEAVARRERPDLKVSSAGVASLGGAQCPPAAVAVARQLGLDLGSHRARSLDASMVAEADVLVAMTPEQSAAIEARGGVGKVRLLSDPEIRDPFGCGEAEYRLCYADIERAVKALLGQLDNESLPTQGGEGVPPATRFERTAGTATELYQQ